MKAVGDQRGGDLRIVVAINPLHPRLVVAEVLTVPVSSELAEVFGS